MLNNWTELYSPTPSRLIFSTQQKVMLPDNTDLDSCLMKCLKISFFKLAQLPWLRCAFLVKL